MPAIINFLQQTGFYMFGQDGNWKCLIMIAVSFVLLYLAIVKGFEPLLLLPIAFGMLCTNLPGADMFHEILFAGGHVHWDLFGGAPITQEFLTEMSEAGVADAVLAPWAVGSTVSLGLLDVLYLGVKLGIYPCLIFMGVGTMTDFGPLIANPKSLLLGAAAQLGIFMTYVGTQFMGFTYQQSASIGIIGGADGPTAIFVTSRLAPELLGPIAVAAYSYMALVPVIQPPIMKALTTKEERKIVMRPLRQVSKREKIIFPIMITVFVALLVPSAAPLIAERLVQRMHAAGDRARALAASGLIVPVVAAAHRRDAHTLRVRHRQLRRLGGRGLCAAAREHKQQHQDQQEGRSLFHISSPLVSFGYLYRRKPREKCSASVRA